MGGLRKFLTRSPAGIALIILLVFVGGYLIASQLSSGARSGEVTAPSQPESASRVSPLPPAPRAGEPSASTSTTPASPPAVASAPAPAQKATPKPATSPSTSSGVPSGPTGRPDPFTPLVRPGGPGLAPATPPPPLVTLPPPPLPGAVPGGPGAGAPSTGPGAGIVVTGIVGDTANVAVVVIDGRSQVLFEGESYGTLRVVKIDASRRLVRFSRDGSQFDVRMGGE